MSDVVPPVEPMLAKAVAKVPPIDALPGGVSYEPKWDGFRVIIFRTTDGVIIQGRGGDDLAYVFPEAVATALESLRPGTVVDGELVIVLDGRLQFEQLSQRIRPRSEAGGWKIAELSAQFPTTFIAFDVLQHDNTPLLDVAYRDRRSTLIDLARTWTDTWFVTPATQDHEEAQRWFAEFEGAGLDGLVCKGLDSTYSPGARTMLKVKHARTADAVVAGWRPFAKPGPSGEAVVGSLLLGLFDDDGRLHHIGVASSFTMARRLELLGELAPYEVSSDTEHPWLNPDGRTRIPGGVSRWTGKKDLSWTPLQPSLVAEVAYDQMEGDRFRHVARFVRWRPDRTAASCGYDQLDRPVRYDLDSLLASVDRRA